MRAVIDGIEVEGTPQELAAFLESIRTRAAVPGAAQVAQPDDQRVHSGHDDAITIDFAYRTLRRLPLSSMQKALLLTLKVAHPDWVGASAIQRKMSWSGMQLGGVLGGLGRRLTATKGYQPDFELWKWRWDEDEGEYAYRLPDAVVAALEKMEL